MAIIESARALLIDPEDRVLLIKLAFGAHRAIWLTPGGSLHPGESHAQDRKSTRLNSSH